jgi:hypothetical protein
VCIYGDAINTHRTLQEGFLVLGAHHSSGAIFGWIDKDASLE